MVGYSWVIDSKPAAPGSIVTVPLSHSPTVTAGDVSHSRSGTPGVARKIVLFHTMDPRGNKLGGIETHVRLVLARHPERRRVLFVGIDERGDLPLGRVTPLTYEGRTIEFLPVTRVVGDQINKAATTVGQSTTLRFMFGLLRHGFTLRRALRVSDASGEIERFEFAIVLALISLPFVLIVHNEGSREDKMDSLLKRYWFVHRAAELIALTLADSVIAVNASIARRIEQLSIRFSRKTMILSVSVDTEKFVPTPFAHDGDAFHVCFAGRLDDFKDPPLMFATLALLQRRLSEQPIGRFRRVVFDYVGASDPMRFDAFAAIADLTVRHGIRGADEVATIMRSAHAGIITSFFEGMPCYLLEMLASGRPVGAISLPQFLSVIVPGRSGALVDRGAMPEVSAQALASGLAGIAAAIDGGMLDPVGIAALAAPYAVDAQMGRLFACHDAIGHRM